MSTFAGSSVRHSEIEMANRAPRFSRNGGTKSLLIVLTMLLSGCASVHFGAEIPCDEWKNPSTAKYSRTNEDQLHVITWNLHGLPNTGDISARLRRVARELRYRGPDLLLLQEVWFDGDAKELETELEKDLENGLEEELYTALADKYTRVPDDPKVSSGFMNSVGGFRNGGLLAFTKKGSTWETNKKASTFAEFKLAAPKWRVFETDGISTKGIQRFVLSNPRLARNLQIFNTHLQSQYGDGRRYVQIRKAQIGELTTLANTEYAANQGLVTQLTFGDFNTFPTERELYKEITDKWNDLTSRSREECNCGTSLDVDEDPQSGTPTAVEAEWIDYAFARRDTNVHVVDARRFPSSASTIDCPFSDHYGLEFMLRIGD